MDPLVQRLIEMGATPAQARVALRETSGDVMVAAERFFDGKYDYILDLPDDEDDDEDDDAGPLSKAKKARDSDDEDGDEKMQDEEDDDDADLYEDYDSDYDQKAENARHHTGVDPYAGIFFSKERKEEVIEVEEESEVIEIDGLRVPLMTQGEWMKGCPEGAEQGFLFALYQSLSFGSRPCPYQCGGSVEHNKADFFAIHRDFLTYIDKVQGKVRQACPLCSKTFCLACGESYSAPDKSRPGIAAEDELFHCANLQGVILGMGLSMVQQLFADQAKNASNSPGEPEKKKRKTDKVAGTYDEDEDVITPSGAQKLKGGIGYAGSRQEDMSGYMEALATQKTRDTAMATLLSAVRKFLPSVRREGGGRASDYLVHPTTLAHIRRRFNLVCSTLLRNDSLSDMSDRSVLYSELFYWLETISNHEALASIMAMPIMVISTVKEDTVRKGAGKSRSTRERTILYEGSSGPRELLEAIVIQAEAALKGLEGVIKARQAQENPETMTEEQKRQTTTGGVKGKGREADQVYEENDRLLKFCTGILNTASSIDRSLTEVKGDAFMDRMYGSLPRISAASRSRMSSSPLADAARASRAPALASDASEAEARKVYEAWATNERFQYCDLTVPTSDGLTPQGGPNYKFYFNSDARMLANSVIPKRSLAIARELAVLTTNLPVAWDSSIFLRVDETRVDIIKALITGPEGTPYENGTFLFDIFLGPSYNQLSPSVKYMTTNNGTFRFNPNLYADGKVCLSLLGTWDGPGWIAGKSTLLQVLISIQSMILCEEPYLNEPGWSTLAGTKESKEYSANVRRMAVHTAMIGNLKNPPEPFGDVIRTHFKLKAKTIIKQMDKWLAMDDRRVIAGQGPGVHKDTPAASSSETPFQKDVAELKRLLVKLERGDPLV